MSSEFTGVTVRSFVSEDAPRMMALQSRCLEQCPDISLLPAGFYHSPGFAGGKNILCAMDDTGAHVGHAMVMASHIHRELHAWMLWMDLRVDPEFDRAGELQDFLLAKITARARAVAKDLDGPAMLYATYFGQGESSIAYLASRGFERFERIYQLRRDLSLEIPVERVPDGVDVRAWRMETEAEQELYLDAYDSAFENESKPLDQLQHFMGSPAWDGGTTLTAFHEDQVIGSVMAFYDPDPVRNRDRCGSSEYVFVRPEWRRRGIARCLLTRTLWYLRERGMDYASLEVLAANASALALYESMGYARWREEVSLGARLGAPSGLEIARVI